MAWIPGGRLIFDKVKALIHNDEIYRVMEKKDRLTNLI